MKFNCDETMVERYARKMQRKMDWHCKFAWWPVRVGVNDCRWLEYVSRKGTPYSGWDGIEWTYEYKALPTYFC